MAFIGQAEVMIDAKARLAVPAKFRDPALRDPPLAGERPAASQAEAPSAEAEGRTVWVSTPRADGTIWLYPEGAYFRLADQLGQSLSPEDDETELNRILFGYAERVTEDGAHRLTLPRKHLDLTGLSGEVMVIGSFNHLEVHPKAQWEAREAERLAKLPSLAAKLRQQRGQ